MVKIFRQPDSRIRVYCFRFFELRLVTPRQLWPLKRPHFDARPLPLHRSVCQNLHVLITGVVGLLSALFHTTATGMTRKRSSVLSTSQQSNPSPVPWEVGISFIPHLPPSDAPDFESPTAFTHHRLYLALISDQNLDCADAPRPVDTMDDGSQQDEVPLDVRMRNLILKNAANTQDVRDFGAASQLSPASAPAQDGDTSLQQNPNHKPRQKRPNQAQRRQMSSQLSIPIDHRSLQAQEDRSYGNFSGHNHRQNHQQRNQYPQPNAISPANMNAGFTRGGPQSRSRHHPSPSHPGFPTSPALLDWGPPGGGQNGYGGSQPGSARSNHFGRNSTGQGRALYTPQPYSPRIENLDVQVAMLEQITATILANAEIELVQIQEKEDFRLLIEDACRAAITEHEKAVNGRTDFPSMSVQLRCFGSLASGFATKSSDMDLGLLSPFSHPQPDAPGSQIPRIVEKTFLNMGFGARLLSKTRVAIIKVCQNPPQKLYRDLLEERGKWERGEQDLDVEDEETPDGQATSPIDSEPAASKMDANGKPAVGSHKRISQEVIAVSGNDYYQIRLEGLKQGSKSLSNYYGAAKKLLRELGGCDITNSTAASFSKDDYRILNDVCAAFIHGLADKDLRTRLQRHLSLAFDPATPMPTNRSIFGVMLQIEGEKMIMAWESRVVREKDEISEKMARSRVDQWLDVQNKTNFGLDPLTYNKELQLANETLAKIPSIGLMILEQGQHETASSYHSRAIRLMIELGGHDFLTVQTPILSAVTQQYAHGIYDLEIRSQVSEFLRSLEAPSLRAVARRHKTLQLAREFEKALNKDLYSAEFTDDIRGYIELLRGPMIPVESREAHFDSVLPMTSEYWVLVAKMRLLQDPSRLSPNQPRDRYKDSLEYPKSGIGVQCDINFSAQLALQNTHLLRCYSLTDPRVRPLVLFVKQWAKLRGINTAYRGTLSSYGYVLMVLHYLINVARPFVCPNLQVMAPPVPPNLTPEQIESTVQCRGRDVRFWRDEDQIVDAAKRGQLTQNQDPIGLLLRGFFEYYAQNNMMSFGHMRGFDWGRDVISIRTPGGLVSKQEKGWTGAKTVLEVRGPDIPLTTEPTVQQANPTSAKGQGNSQENTSSQPLPSPDIRMAPKAPQDRSKPEVKEVRHRFLFAIEDPFEWDHNVARTVTHNGIVSIRDEFRRAWRIIRNAGRSVQQEDLLRDVSLEEKSNGQSSFWELLDEIHGQPPADAAA